MPKCQNFKTSKWKKMSKFHKMSKSEKNLGFLRYFKFYFKKN